MAKRDKRDTPPVHPGEILKADFLVPLGLSVNALSRAIGVPRTRLNDVVLGRRGISADTAVRLARYFRVSAQFWMNLQSHYELEVAEESIGKRLDRGSNRTRLNRVLKKGRICARCFETALRASSA